MNTSVLTKLQIVKDYKQDIQVLICLIENAGFGSNEKPYYELICGKSMYSYLENIASDYERKLVILEEDANLIEAIKPYVSGKFKTTVVLFSDTPLLRKEVLENYIHKFLLSGESFITMPRGFIFKTEDISKIIFIEHTEFGFFETNDFFKVKNLKTLAEANEFMQDKIIEFYLSNGVKIPNRNSVVIDADVEIGKGSEICPFSVLKGRTIIGENTLIGFSEIINSKIGSNCEVKHCFLTNAKVADNTKVKPFSTSVKGAK